MSQLCMKFVCIYKYFHEVNSSNIKCSILYIRRKLFNHALTLYDMMSHEQVQK